MYKGVKKTVAVILGLTLACVGLSACDMISPFDNSSSSSVGSSDVSSMDSGEDSDSESSNDSSGDMDQEELGKGGLTQEQWNAAFETTLALENVSIVYDYIFPGEIVGNGSMDIADEKVYYHWEDVNYPYTCAGYLGKQGDTVYEWIQEGSSWYKTPLEVATTYYATARGTLRYFSYLDFDGYASWYENAVYDETTETFSFAATTRNEAYPAEVQVIIRNGRIYSLAYEYTELASDNHPVYYEKYTFTNVGITTVGDLPSA